MTMEVKGESSLRGSERRPRPTQKVQKEQQTGEIRFLCSCGSYRHRAFSTNGTQEKGGFTSKVDFHFFFTKVMTSCTTTHVAYVHEM